MKYTFILPAYKAEHLKEALDSIKAQTYQDFTVIISNDCSPENLDSIALPYTSDSRFVYRKNEHNIGGINLVDHWNMLLNSVESEWVIVASDDDTYDKQFLEEIDKLTYEYPQVNLLRSRVNKIDNDGVIIQVDGLYDRFVDYLGFFCIQENNLSIKCVGNYVFRTGTLKSKGGFVYFPLAWFSDTASAIMMAENGCANTSLPLFNFRFSGSSISSSRVTKSSAKQKALATIEFNEWMLDAFDKLSSNNKLMANMISFCVSQHKAEITNSVEAWFFNCSFTDFIQLVNRYTPCRRLRLRYYLRFVITKKLL